MHFTISTRLGKSADICRKRYAASFRRYNECFRREMAKHEEMQRCAIDAMRVHRWALRTNHLKYSFLIDGNLNTHTDNRTFAITTLWLPLHSKREINSTLETLEKVCYIWDKSQNWNSWKVYLFRFSPPRKDDACRRFSSRRVLALAPLRLHPRFRSWFRLRFRFRALLIPGTSTSSSPSAATAKWIPFSLDFSLPGSLIFLPRLRLFLLFHRFVLGISLSVAKALS